MHYKNSRPAVNGDHVITKNYNGNTVAGVIYDLVETEQSCNCSVSVIVPGGSFTMTCKDVGKMYHAEDAFECAEAVWAPEAEAPAAIPATPATAG